MTDNLWRPWHFYSVGVKISRFLCIFAAANIINKAIKKNMKAFVFPGQGAQFVGMGKDLYENNPLAKE